MSVRTNPNERRCLVSVAEAIGLMVSFGMFIVSFLDLILKISCKKQNKKRLSNSPQGLTVFLFSSATVLRTVSSKLKINVSALIFFYDYCTIL